jgi:hypothetical protein
MSDETVKSTPTTFNIRPLQARDYPIWRRLFDGYITFYKSHVADDVVKLTFARLLSDEPGTHEALVVGSHHLSPVNVVADALLLLGRSIRGSGSARQRGGPGAGRGGLC